MGRYLLAATVSLGALVAVQAAQASTIVHDIAVEFSTIDPAQGPRGTSLTVAGTRSITGNLFDNNLETMFSLGRGGSIEFEISPATGRYITGGQTIELTGGTSGFPERVSIFLGNDLTDWVEVGTMSNGHLPNTAGWSGVNGAIISTSYVAAGSPAGRNPTFNFTVVSGFYDSVRLVDVPQIPPGGPVLDTYDGFDIVEFQLTSALLPVQVPEPGTLALLGAGLLGLVATRRRKPA